ncbi:MAG: hypothetical protein R2991_05050 [Thermoanaerobaculia bacterium]
MGACYRRLPPLLVAATLVAGPATRLPAAPLALRDVCDETTELDLIGVDTAARTALLALPSRQEGIPAWLLEVGPAEAALYPDLHPAGRCGGSAGPGPVLAFERCGGACVQAAAWTHGEWRPAGPPFDTGGGAILHAARDGAGNAWIVQHFQGSEEHTRRVVAARLEGESWREAGTLEVSGAGNPPAVADPDDPEALLSGSGRFALGRAPAHWVTMPPLPADSLGSLVPLGGGHAAFLTADSRLLVTRDGGGRWFEQQWTPWSAGAGVTRWDRGKDYWLDLPTGAVAGGLSVLWFDDRPGSEPALWLTAGEGPTGLVAAAVPRAPRAGAEPIEEAIRWAGDTWMLLGGCRHDERTAYVLVRSPDGRSTGAWERVPLTPGW